ncbi:anaerobic ribonucleoside-triphosphate reductase [Nitrososphaera sp.]|uniref:anaerobic ribonucleoside-triphosphate reductase n=1 Tax=Nitrososphaera sp. TaxID=1971748 RepID=UPI00307F4120
MSDDSSSSLSQQQQKELRKGGVLESASKRVRMIFSVMASPNRIDILRILNTKGPLTYSELKALAGFKSKKESGKFAYHLRKLLRQLLVALNKAERRYTITNLGKLVLSLARQIEERSIIESGKMYVRTTSRHSIEEFNSHKIIQSLVREAGLPLEQAHKITEEVENKIYKFQTAYLTSSLIRETVNSVLIEHGHEEYRNKLARLGLPPADIAAMLASEEATRNGVPGIIEGTANTVFSEYLVFNTLPKDIADMHLAGEINIANPGTWSLTPDTLFVDLGELGSFDLQGRFPSVARLASLNRTPDDMLAALPVLIPLLASEASSEVVLEGVAPVLAKMKGAEELSAGFARALVASSAFSSSGPLATIVIPADTTADSRQAAAAMLDGYRRYVEATPVPRIAMSVAFNNNNKQQQQKDVLDHVAAAVRSGGTVAVISGGDSPVRGVTGVRKPRGSPAAAMAFQALSINLPRLAYESNRDETYFRAKLALMIKPSLAALVARKKAVVDGAKRGLLPAFASASQSMHHATAGVMVNLTGAREAVYGILGHGEAGNGPEILQKVLKTAVEVAGAEGKKLGEESAGVAMVSDGSAARFAALDSEKYGRVSLSLPQQQSYSQGMTLLPGKGDMPGVRECAAIDRVLNGGFAATADVTDLSAADIKGAIESAAATGELAFLRLQARLAVCATCGSKYRSSLEKCERCKSPHRLQLSS